MMGEDDRSAKLEVLESANLAISLRARKAAVVDENDHLLL